MSPSHLPFSRFPCLLILASAVLACTSDGNTDPDPGTGPGGAELGGGGTQQAGNCTENALFAPQSYGEDGNDMIRRVELRPGGGLLLSTWQELYELPEGSSTPVKLMDRPESSLPLGGTFWPTDDALLMPGASSVAAIITAANPGGTTEIIPVLFSAPHGGGAATLKVSAPAPPEDLVFYEIHGVRVVGDDVFWIDARVERESFGTGAPLDRTYRARRTSWRTPAAAPTELYTSERQLDVPIVANGIAFIDEDNNDRADGGSVQRMIHLDDGSVDAVSANERFGGKVVAADDESLLVFHDDFSDLETYGLFRVAPDGSEPQRLIQIYLDLGRLGQEFRSRDGVWGYTDFDSDTSVQGVYAYEPGSAPRRVGCISGRGTTVHDVLVGDDELFVSVYYGAGRATILRYPL
jgi:hypothetical protein